MENETDREKERKESQHLIPTSKNIQVFNFFWKSRKTSEERKNKEADFSNNIFPLLFLGNENKSKMDDDDDYS